jgi:2'-5' RNA ligase
LDGLFPTFFDPSRHALPGGARSPSLMSERLSRFSRNVGLKKGPRPANSDRLFFAVLPDEETRQRIAERSRHLRAAHGLTGKDVRPEHFHVTLHHVAGARGAPPPQTIEALAERARNVVMPSFKIEFDRALSFRNGALVLAGDDSAIGLHVLQQRLSDALEWRPGPARRFNPHLTLLRDDHHVAEQPIEPIAWTAREIVLVHSLLGRTTHLPVARIPLG